MTVVDLKSTDYFNSDNAEEATVFPKAKEELSSSLRWRKCRLLPISGARIQSGYLILLFHMQENDLSCSTDLQRPQPQKFKEHLAHAFLCPD